VNFKRKSFKQKNTIFSHLSAFFYLNENQQVMLQKYTNLENIIFLRHFGMFGVNFSRKKEQIEHCCTRYQRIIISKNDRHVLKRV